MTTDSADHLVNSVRRMGGNGEERRRAVHDIGVVAEGRFVPSGNLRPWCRTECLTVGSSTAVVRFSSFKRSSWARRYDIRGMACRLVTDNRAGNGPQTGQELDLVAITSPRFFVRREEDLHHLARAGGDLRRVGRLATMAVTRRTTFLAASQLLLASVGPPLPRPRELAAQRYYGVHTFWLEQGGDRRAARYHWRPVSSPRRRSGELDLSLRAQLAGDDDKLEFDLVVDLFDDPVPYRKTNDPLRRYPSCLRELRGIRSLPRWEGTTRVTAGRLTLTSCPDDHPDEYPGGHPAARRWVFNPVPVIAGFEPSDDEILLARGGAYTASHVRRRTAEEQQP